MVFYPGIVEGRHSRKIPNLKSLTEEMRLQDAELREIEFVFLGTATTLSPEHVLTASRERPTNKIKKTKGAKTERVQSSSASTGTMFV